MRAQHLNPFSYFASYPSAVLDVQTCVSLRAAPDWRMAMRHALFSVASEHRPAEAMLAAIEDNLRHQARTVGDIAAQTGLAQQDVLLAVSLLAKWGAVDLGPDVRT